ncbi:MAG: hypothetical protein AAF488_14760, partial [Planctomycetota bacterium]
MAWPQTRSLVLLLTLSALLAGLANSCGDSSPATRIESAEFRDDQNANGVIDEGETILLRLSEALPPSFDPSNIQISAVPDAGYSWFPLIRRGDSELELVVTIENGDPQFRIAGVYPDDAEATGLVIDLGDQVEQSVDLQPFRRSPVLVRAEWVDSFPLDGDGAVNAGDRLRLYFDAPVRVSDDALNSPVGGQVILSKDSLDQLGDELRPARFVDPLDSDAQNIVEIELGHGPVLTIPGQLPAETKGIDRSSFSAPSGIALGGTSLSPLSSIVSRYGSVGAASLGEIDIDFPDEYAQPIAHSGAVDVGRHHFTLTQFAEVYTVIVGGRDADRNVLDDVTILRPQAGSLTSARPVHRSLGRPSTDHTATRLAGPGEWGIFDEYVVLTGGFDGANISDRISVVRLPPASDFVVETLEAKLVVPRRRHVAVAVGPNTLLIDGGETRDSDGTRALVGCAELIEFARVTTDDGASTKLVVSKHQTFHSVPRSDHTLSLLPGADRARWVLMYGGFGAAGTPRLGKPCDANPALLSYNAGRVLTAPILWSLDRPETSIALDMSFDVRAFRRLHNAVTLTPENGPTQVLLVGGVTKNPIFGFRYRGRNAPNVSFDRWEQLWAVSDEDARTSNARPKAESAASAILFTFRHDNPAASEVKIVPHPYPRLSPGRTNATATFVSDIGVLISGGTTASSEVDTIELYNPAEGRLALFALRLKRPRAGHRALLVTNDGETSLFLVGGTGPEGIS